MNSSEVIPNQPLVVILGPTATGKTEVGIQVAQCLGGEVISADSMQVYRYMDIGTAKPTMEERQGIPHHLIDIVTPDQNFSAAMFQENARQHINSTIARGKVPILVGGTGLYIRAVIDPYSFNSAGIDQAYRMRMQEGARQYGRDWLHRELAAVDPQAAARLHPNDVKRVIRALEVFKLTGQTLAHTPGGKRESPYNLIVFGLSRPRAQLYSLIEHRVDRMIGQGLVNEVSQLLQWGYERHLKSMQSLGYKEVAAHLAGELTLGEAITLIKRNTRRFAKRQLTWFRHEHRVNWLELELYNGSGALASQIAKSAAGVLAVTSNK